MMAQSFSEAQGQQACEAGSKISCPLPSALMRGSTHAGDATGCAHWGGADWHLELGADSLPALPLEISLTPTLENVFHSKVHLAWRGKLGEKCSHKPQVSLDQLLFPTTLQTLIFPFQASTHVAIGSPPSPSWDTCIAMISEYNCKQTLVKTTYANTGISLIFPLSYHYSVFTENRSLLVLCMSPFPSFLPELQSQATAMT